MSFQKNTTPEEKFLFKIRPRFISTMTAQVLRIIILLLLLYFFSAIISFATVIQGTSTDLINIPFVQWTTYVLILIIALIFFIDYLEHAVLEIHVLHTDQPEGND